MLPQKLLITTRENMCLPLKYVPGWFLPGKIVPRSLCVAYGPRTRRDYQWLTTIATTAARNNFLQTLCWSVSSHNTLLVICICNVQIFGYFLRTLLSTEHAMISAINKENESNNSLQTQVMTAIKFDSFTLILRCFL